MKIYLTSAQTGVTAPLSADLYVINKYYPTLKLPTLYPGRLCRPMLQEILEILNTQHFPAHGLHFTSLASHSNISHDIERRGSQLCRNLAAAAAALSGDKQMRSRITAECNRAITTIISPCPHREISLTRLLLSSAAPSVMCGGGEAR